MGDGAGGDGTAVRDLALRADETEAWLLARFASHAVLRGVEELEQRAFLELLLQRRFLSLLFAVMYDAGIDGLADDAAIALVREILREEYPDPSGGTPSHREDLVHDLLVLGATRAQVLAARPTVVTASVVEETLGIMLDAAAAGDDVGVLTILRFWGEVLVSIEYGAFWRRMGAAFDAAGVASRFYEPHHHHDGAEPLALASDASTTHSGRLGACLARLLVGDAGCEEFARVERRVLDARVRFYDQFLAPSPSGETS
ncbi:MAG: hypothetical protein QOJ35_841 [Solirubrobacteraceae bacterium]|jgi:hypothetical protein|nr:hypothetical protein [Solirubrobacteraceae bacterium]